MKEIIGKANLLRTSHLPQKITVSKINLLLKAKIANEFNRFFPNIGIELASEIPPAKTTFKNELKDAFFSLKINVRVQTMTK